MVQKWHLVELEYSDPCLNMALEEAIPTMVGKGLSPETLRFWRNMNSVVVGRFQHVESEVNLEACKKHGVKIVRRFTGGGAVYHDLGNLNYAISLRRNNPILRGDILESFKILSLGVAEGLRSIGLNLTFGLNNMIQISGRKASGMAGSVSGGAFFQHGTLLVNTNLRILREVLDIPEVEIREGKGVRSIRSAVTSIREELSNNIPISQVKEAIIKGFETAHSVRIVQRKLSPEEMEMTKTLYDTKYSREKWNLEI